MNNSKVFLLVAVVSFVLSISCGNDGKQEVGQSESGSALINRINAVQQQVMAQGNINVEEEHALLSLCSIVSQNDGLANYNSDSRILLKDVEITPIFNGCEELSKIQTKECFENKIVAFIKREFNLKISKDLDLSEPKQVDAFFVIDEAGNLTGKKVRDSELTVQAEILRVFSEMPKMKPAVHKGENVAVLCSIIIKYASEIDIEVVHIPEIPSMQ